MRQLGKKTLRILPVVVVTPRHAPDDSLQVIKPERWAHKKSRLRGCNPQPARENPQRVSSKSDHCASDFFLMQPVCQTADELIEIIVVSVWC
ncbi:hypothetical protein V22_33800 [Calycomorphotria hydatis]|uniref:Uncharacterized protein n=1 Tax=Calycomorphotria hydatis TaxID=2528027 RepID=A0A517TCL7_9PLAN|nr:hypothetical protein V22_33800 [Calycomorphotria hydatis]